MKIELIFLPLLLLFFSSNSHANDILTPSHPLSNGETLISANGTFALGFFSPPNTTNLYLAIWYNNLAVQTLVWIANRQNPIPNLNATLSLTPGDSSLHLLTSPDSTPLWSSPSFPNPISNPIAQLLDSGNFIIKSPNSTSHLWQTFDHPTDTLLAGMKLGPQLKTHIDRNLTSWLTNSDPSPGKYVLAIDPIGVPQLVIRHSSGTLIWRGGPWNGYAFSGALPKLKLYSSGLYRDYNQFFNSSPDEIYFYFNTIGGAVSKLNMDQDGVARLYKWSSSSHEWDFGWSAPKDPCDFFESCGSNAICDSSISPMCQCLDGFDPRNRVSWSGGDWSEGCVRVEELGCGVTGSDDFMVVRGTVLPDTREAVGDMSLGLEECKTRCSMNCSCKAYATVFLNVGVGCMIWTGEIRDLRAAAEYKLQDLYVRVAPLRNGSDGTLLFFFC